jgi:hypothetical protein
MRNLEDVKKDIEYIRNLERFAVFMLGLNEIYSLFETNKASDKVRHVISQYLKGLSDIRKEFEDEIKQIKG